MVEGIQKDLEWHFKQIGVKMNTRLNNWFIHPYGLNKEQYVESYFTIHNKYTPDYFKLYTNSTTKDLCNQHTGDNDARCGRGDICGQFITCNENNLYEKNGYCTDETNLADEGYLMGASFYYGWGSYLVYNTRGNKNGSSYI